MRSGRHPGPILVALALLFLPSLVYWETITHRYGFRDDYPSIREAQEDPENIMRFIGSQGRPLYACLVIASFRPVEAVADLSWIRWFSALLLGAAAAFLFWILIHHGWSLAPAALTAALFLLLPGSQVIVAWAVAWPHALSMLLAAAAFYLAERAASSARPGPRRLLAAAAIAVLAVTFLIYPVSALFYLVAFAGVFLSRVEAAPGQTFFWGLRHAAVVLIGALLAAATAVATMSALGLSMSHRASPDRDPMGKLAWFVTEPLRDALALIVMNDRPDGASPLVVFAALLVALVLAAGAVLRFRLSGLLRAALWTIALLTLPPAAYLGSLVAGERLNAYRTSLPMSAILLLFFAASLGMIAGRRAAAVVLAALALVALPLARRQPLELFAHAQSEELAIVEAAAKEIPNVHPVTVYAYPAEHPHDALPRRHADEFGSLSADGHWIVREMLLQVLRERHAQLPPSQFREGPPPPEPSENDLIIDMRQLRKQRS